MSSIGGAEKAYSEFEVFAGGAAAVGRSVGEVEGPDGDRVADDISTTQVIGLDAPISGYANFAGDTDWYRITLTAGLKYQFSLDATVDGPGGLDCFVNLRDARGFTIASDDDSGPGSNALLGFTVTSTGTYYVAAGGAFPSTGGYTLTVRGLGTPSPLDSIDWGTQVADPAVIHVYFAGAGETYDGVTSLGWNAYEIQQAMLAFAQYSAVCPINFVITDNAALADFKLVTANGSDDGVLGYFNPPGEPNAGVGVFYRNGAGWDEQGGGGLERGGLGFTTLVHEFGHALGLAHPHDEGGSSTIMEGVFAPFRSYGLYGLNQGVYTTMSYNDGWNGTPWVSDNYGSQGGPMALDLAVLQQKYGANTTHHDGDDTYVLPSEDGPGTFYAVIWDTGGVDTIVYDGTRSATINLTAATLDYSETGGGVLSRASNVAGGFTIAAGVVIENATGGAGNDQIVGNAANNVLSGRDGADTIEGRAGDDVLDGGDGGDKLYGGDGDDRLIGGAGNDQLYGGTGADILEGGDGDDSLDGGDGDDLMYGGDGNDTFFISAGTDLLDGGNGSDLLRISQAGRIDLNVSGPQIVGSAKVTLRGIENLAGSDGDDVLIGDAGDNALDGGLGNDRLVGGAGNDRLVGSYGDDVLIGGLGDDWLDGGGGWDVVDYSSAASGVTMNPSNWGQVTGEGTDTLLGIEALIGSSFADVLFGQHLEGRGGNDRLTGSYLDGGAGDDQLTGLDWTDDVLEGGAGADVLNGGDGFDEARYLTAAAAVSINLTTGVHTGEAAGDTFISIERYVLSRFGDQFTGSAEADDVAGGSGNDILSGAAGDDVLDGGSGNDILRGGLGADRLVGGAGIDQASYQLATSAVSINLTTGVHTGEAAGDTFDSIERFVLTGYGDQFAGSAGVDEAVGYYGNDILFGAAGDDKLDGGNGNDILRGGEGADQLIGGTGTDTASYQIATAAVTLNLTTGVHTGEAAGDTFDSIERYALSTLDDSFIGSAGADWVDGWKGNDVLYGQGGADQMFGNEGNDQLYGGAGNDVLHGDGGIDILYGDAGADILYGGTGADQLFGGDDGDFLWGEAGNDVLTGGAGADRFAFSYESGVDIITDFQRGQDKIILKGMVGIDDFSDLRISADVHGWAVITWGDGASTVTLNGVAAGQVTASDVWFT